MCEVIRELYKDKLEAGWAISRQEGHLMGRLEGIKAMIMNYLEEDFPAQRIMEKLEKDFGYRCKKLKVILNSTRDD